MSTPFMQLYVADYLGDTRHLTTEQHGAYLLLLMAMWRAGGFLPADDTKLARIASLTLARWNRTKGEVMAFLMISDGQITQKRLLAEIKKAEEKSQKRAEAGRIGGLSKPLKENKPDEAIASVLLKHSSEPEPEKKDDDEGNAGASGGGLFGDEPEPEPEPVEDPVFLKIPTNKFETEGEEYPVTAKMIVDFQQLYPAVDVEQEVRAMRAWNISNQPLRKTRKGMTRFVNGWLQRQQDRNPKGVSRETTNRREENRPVPFGAGVARAVDARAGGGLFPGGGQEIIVPANTGRPPGDRDENLQLRHDADAA